PVSLDIALSSKFGKQRLTFLRMEKVHQGVYFLTGYPWLASHLAVDLGTLLSQNALLIESRIDSFQASGDFLHACSITRAQASFDPLIRYHSQFRIHSSLALGSRNRELTDRPEHMTELHFLPDIKTDRGMHFNIGIELRYQI